MNFGNAVRQHHTESECLKYFLKFLQFSRTFNATSQELEKLL